MTREEAKTIIKERYKMFCNSNGDCIEWNSKFTDALEVVIQDLDKLEKIEQLIDNWTKTEELEWKIREVLDND